jgi:D-alanyl-D-alanine carboxypeptidase
VRTLTDLTGAIRLKRKVLRRTGAAVVGALIVSVALSLLFAAGGHESKGPVRAADGMFVMDDFESGALTGWRAVGSGSGGWFVYSSGSRAPDPAQSDPNVPFDFWYPPQGRFAAVTDMNGPGTLILYRDVKLDGRFMLRLTEFHASASDFSTPRTLASDEPGDNQQFRIDLVAPSAPIDSLARGDVLENVFKMSTSDLDQSEPAAVKVDVSHWAGHTVRLRLAVADKRGPLRVGVDDIRFEPIDSDANARIELPNTKAPSRALNLVLHRLTEAQALKALSARAERLAGEGAFSGALLVAKNDHVLFSHAYGLADRKRGIPNTIRTRFRIGSMNKMFTAVAILQLVDAGKIELTAALGKYLTHYPNRDVAKVTIHQLLTHTGGTGDIFGPDFDQHRTELRTLADYVRLYDKRGLEFQPGSDWSYSNYGFILLGRVIEKVTGQSYYDYVQQHIYAPAGMARSGSLPEDQAVPERSTGYTKPPEATASLPNTDTLPYRGTSAGGGYSTVEDLARFAQALFSHKLLSPDSTKLLITGKVNAGPARYAYGFEDARDAHGNGWVGHGGGAPGMNGDLRIYPKSGYVIAVLANLDPPAAQRISEYLDPRLPAKR